MPAKDIVYYQESDGSVPVLDWLVELARRNRRAAEKCLAQIEVLRELGHELRRPMANFLRDGIHELRVRVGRSQHRVLYFFHGRNAVVLVHGLTKESEVPPKDIERALGRKRLFEKNPSAHTHRKESSNG
jgi:phage-related protein